MSYKEIVDDESLVEELYRKEYYQYKSDTIINKNDILEDKYLKPSSNQEFAANFINPQNKNNRLLNMGQAGCHPADTPILMHDFSVKMSQDIGINDLIMGVDMKPRRVLSTSVGEGEMFKITPLENKPFYCNKDHILSLYSERISKYLDITVDKYLTDQITLQRLGYYLYLDPILNIDDSSCFTDDDLDGIAANPYKSEFMDLAELMKMSYKRKLKFMAKYIDLSVTDQKFGEVQILHVDENMGAAITKLSLSLGIFCFYDDFTLTLCGKNINCLPSNKIKATYKTTNLPKKITFPFIIESTRKVEKYYGMFITDDNRYILADSFIVTHNSGKTLFATQVAHKFTQLYKAKYDELVAKLGTSRYVRAELDANTPSVFVLGVSGTFSAFITELLKYTEYGFINEEELSIMNEFRTKNLLNTDEYKDFFAKLKKRITNKSKGGFFVFYGYQTFVNRLFESDKIKLIDMEKILVIRRKKDPELTLHDLILEYVESGDISVNQLLLDKLKNSLLICDEVHYTYNSITKNNYGVAIQYIVDNVPSLKSIFMSATPINNNPSEVVEIMSLLTSKKYKKSDLFINNKYLREGALATIKWAFHGKVSFVQDVNPKQFPEMIFRGCEFIIKTDVDNFKAGDKFPYIKVVRSKMSSNMQSALNEIVEGRVEEESEEPVDYETLSPYSFHRIAPSKYTIFDGVFPNPERPKSGIYTLLELNRLKGENNPLIEFKSDNTKVPSGEYLDYDNIGQWFPKYKDLLDILRAAVGEKCMIAHPKVSMSGVLLIQELLLHNGMISKNMDANDTTVCSICGKIRKTHKSSTDHKFMPVRFLMAHSEMDKKEIEENRNLFNQASNINGELYKIFIGSKVVMVGFTFKEVQHFIMCSFPFNFTSLKQFIGRAVRKFSHDRLPAAKRKVNVHLLVTTVGKNPKDVHSPEEYKYIDKVSSYLSIQKIEKVIHEGAVDASINRSIIMSDELKKTFTNGANFNSIYFEADVKLEDRKLEELTLSTFYAYKFYMNEIRWITFIVKRLFCMNPVWSYGDLWDAVKSPPFGVEFNPNLFAEGNFVHVMIKLTGDNIFCNVPLESNIHNTFDNNHSIIIKNNNAFKIEQIGNLFILFEYDRKNNSTYINPNSYILNNYVEYNDVIEFNDFVEQTQKSKQFDSMFALTTQMFAEGKLSPYYILVELSQMFQIDLIKDIIEHNRRDEMSKYIANLYYKLDVMIEDKNGKFVGYKIRSKKYTWSAGWREEFEEEKIKPMHDIIGYCEDVDYFTAKFKIKTKSKGAKDKRLEDRGIVCETKDKDVILKYLKMLNYDVKSMEKKEIRVKNICYLIATRLIDLEIKYKSTKYFIIFANHI